MTIEYVLEQELEYLMTNQLEYMLATFNAGPNTLHQKNNITCKGPKSPKGDKGTSEIN